MFIFSILHALEVKIEILQENRLQHVQHVPHQHPQLLPGGAGGGPGRRQPWSGSPQRGHPPHRPKTSAGCIGLIQKLDHPLSKNRLPGFPRAAD